MPETETKPQQLYGKGKYDAGGNLQQSHPYYRPMNLDDTQRFVVGAMVVSGAIVIFADLAGAKPSKKSILHLFVGGLLASLGLIAIAEANQNVAKGIAVLIVLGTALTYGGPALTSVRNLSGVGKNTVEAGKDRPSIEVGKSPVLGAYFPDPVARFPGRTITA